MYMAKRKSSKKGRGKGKKRAKSSSNSSKGGRYGKTYCNTNEFRRVRGKGGRIVVIPFCKGHKRIRKSQIGRVL